MKPNKKFSKILLLTVLALTAALLILSACQIVPTPEPTPPPTPDPTPNPTPDKLFHIDGDRMTASVPNIMSEYTFTKDIPILAAADSFAVYTDAEGKQPLKNNTVTLAEGSNLFYLFVTTGKDTKVYTVEINRSSLLTVSFNTGGGTEIGYVEVEKGKTTAPPDVVPKLSGNVFVKWDYDFSKPITESITVNAVYDILPEMKPFVFKAFEDHCEIYGVNDTEATTLTVPDYVTVIKKGAFAKCGKLESLTLPFVGGSPDAAPTTEEAFFTYIFDGKGGNGTYVTWRRWIDENNVLTFSIPKSLTKVTVTKGRIQELAFGGNVSISNIILENGVTEIGNKAFWNNTVLDSVVIPETVTVIGENAFAACYALNSITFSEGLTEIGAYAFRESPLSDGVTLPESLEKLGEYAFTETEASIVTVKSGSIGAFAFSKSELNRVTLGKKVTAIGDGAFSESKLTAITMENGMTAIGAGAFKDCVSLTSVTVPESVKELGAEAFKGCIAMTSLTLLCKASEIPESFCEGCTSLTSVSLPETITRLNTAAFMECGSLKAITLHVGLTHIAESAFEECISLTSITIPETVTVIEARAFSKCSRLESADLPESVTVISDYLFEDCRSLKSIPLHDGITAIGEYAFKGCASVSAVTVPKNITVLSKGMFYGCSSLAEVTVYEGMKQIGEEAFEQCSSLKRIALPTTVNLIAQRAFRLSGLTEFQIPAKVSNLYGSTFAGCESLTSIVIHDGIKEIRDGVFAGCTALKSVTIGSSVTKIGNSAFERCPITEITVPEKVITIGYQAFARTSLITFTVPNTVTSLGFGVFESCASLEEVTIGSGIKTVQKDSFKDCKALKRIIFKDGVELIDEDAFGFVTDIGYVYIPDSLTVQNPTLFGMVDEIGIAENSTVYRIAGNCLIHVESKKLLHACGIPDIPADGSVEIIGPYAFYRLDLSEADITVPDPVTAIAAHAFSSTVGTLRIGNGLLTVTETVRVTDYTVTNLYITDIAKWCGYTTGGSGSLLAHAENVYVDGVRITELVIPEGVTEIKSGAFMNCRWIESIVFPDSMLVIRSRAFSDCTALRKLVLGKRIGKLESYAFSGCEGLTSVTLTKKLTTVEYGAFNACYRLTEIAKNGSSFDPTVDNWSHMMARYALYIHDGTSETVQEGDFIFLTVNGKHLLLSYVGKSENVVLPDSYKGESYALNNYSFCNRSDIKQITFSGGVRSISNNVFWNCTSLTEINAPSVKSVGSYAFKDCTALKNVTFGEALVTISPHVFKNCLALETVTIPITEGWYQYYEYEDIINEDPAYRVHASELDTPKEAAKYVKTTQAYFYLHRIQADTDTEETE